MKLKDKQIQESGALYFEMAIDTIRLNAITKKVRAIRINMEEAQNNSAKPALVVIRTMGFYKMTLRIAATAILLIGSAVIYKFISVNDQSFYNSQFRDYEVALSRGGEANSAEADAYLDKNWNTVIAIFDGQHLNSNEPVFLAAMAHLQLSHFPEAVNLFEKILQNGSADQSFEEESEFYLTLAYIMNHQLDKSMALMNKIKANPEHTYYPLVSKFSAIDLKIMELKKK